MGISHCFQGARKFLWVQVMLGVTFICLSSLPMQYQHILHVFGTANCEIPYLMKTWDVIFNQPNLCSIRWYNICLLFHTLKFHVNWKFEISTFVRLTHAIQADMTCLRYPEFEYFMSVEDLRCYIQSGLPMQY